jgi:hypothetical protein
MLPTSAAWETAAVPAPRARISGTIAASAESVAMAAAAMKVLRSSGRPAARRISAAAVADSTIPSGT